MEGFDGQVSMGYICGVFGDVEQALLCPGLVLVQRAFYCFQLFQLPLECRQSIAQLSCVAARPCSPTTEGCGMVSQFARFYFFFA